MVQPVNDPTRHRTCVSTPYNNVGHDTEINASFQLLCDNMNINLQKMASNRFKYIPPNQNRQWVVPYRLRDNAPAPPTLRDGTVVHKNHPYGHKAPRNRDQLLRFTIEQWYALSDHYSFDWRDSGMDIGECRAHWAAWCGANIGAGTIVQVAVQEQQYLDAAAAEMVLAAQYNPPAPAAGQSGGHA
ncbi:hypothetical protein BJ508DRAFT_312719 [Ascobolus immersus RN42]|uniref:Uncharacterized protein n=1 Tax=Ascobolus immersus RN42 TaxID=1160509 RepID=A0A3N4HMX7_ASCIM|nr:hypothetical protein BJ508DRAFT_312719 [Ascobolus immersus RN42]